jgi:ABC-2 type transport system permease protein
MNAFSAAFWAEALKARRSKVTLLTAGGFLILPVVAGLFMFILKDPDQARAMGLISVKAQITAAVADWPTYFGILTMGTAIAGSILFAMITAWVFGREFSDHTAKELLALPTPRGIVVGAKFLLTALWNLALTLFVFVVALGVGALVDIPGWSLQLAWTSFCSLMLAVLLTSLLMPCVALFASVGRGYLLPLGWAFLTMALAQIVSVMGWSDWFPWAVPGLLSTMNGPRTEPVPVHSYLVVLLVFVVGLAATFAWWQRADQAR